MKTLAFTKLFFYSVGPDVELSSDSYANRVQFALDEMRAVLERHGFTYGRGYTALIARGDNEPTTCSRCGHLVITSDGIMGSSDSDVEFACESASPVDGLLVCESCFAAV